MRLRITFAKTNAMRFTGHLDLHRAWERTIRRARLPLTYSQGFNPRPKINLAAALPLGFTSSFEMVDIWIDDTLSQTEIKSRLRETTPPGIEIIQVETVDPKGPKLPNLIQSSVYEITLQDPVNELEDQIKTILNSKMIMRVRRGKEYDLRPLIEDFSLQPEEKIKFHIQLAARPGATGRPDEVLSVLGIPPHTALVHRTEIIFQIEETE